jgi:hypothetical protein
MSVEVFSDVLFHHLIVKLFFIFVQTLVMAVHLICTSDVVPAVMTSVS